jgi:hypothetical protein
MRCPFASTQYHERRAIRCSRRRPRSWFLGVHSLAARPPLLSGGVRLQTTEEDEKPHPVHPSHSGNIAITIITQAGGRCVCEMTPSLEGRTGPSVRFHGQNPKYAIAVGLESLARTLRLETEAEQQVDWEAVDGSPSGAVKERRFHVILHYERVAEEESKFEAMHNTLLGNTAVENAEIAIIQVDPDLPVEAWERRHKHS